jgi:hypothetical protein
MPLLSGKKNIGRNIKELYEANKDKPAKQKRGRDQIIAIAMSEARKGKT